MPNTVGLIKAQVKQNEGFDIEITQHGNTCNANKQVGDLSYDVKTMADISVSSWVAQFEKLVPGFSAQVIDSNGEKAHGRTLISNL